MQRIRIRTWDLPTRLVHWAMVLLVAFSWWTAETERMDYHRYSGYTLLGLLVFRLFWGVFGSRTARFTNFVKGPRKIIAYLRARAVHHDIGHNPLGALSVVVLLLLLITQVVLGLFAVDIDGLESGPLSYMVSFDTGRLCAKIHGTVFNVLMAMVILHVVAILFYAIAKKDNLVGPMITGYKHWLDPKVDENVHAAWWMVLIGAALAGGVVWWIV